MKHKVLVSIVVGSFMLAFAPACGDECGDGICGDSEDRELCPQDCAECGDGFCDPGEDLSNCEEDCYDPCVLEATEVGAECMAHTECGDGGYCESFEGDAGPRCYQVCDPEGCPDGDLCAEGESCVSIVDEDGEQLLHHGQPLGVCYDMPEGDQGAYERCGESYGACQGDMVCGTLDPNYGGFCLPPCDAGGACPDASNGMAGTCALVTEEGAQNPDHCALVGCGEEEPCPEGMECVDLGGNFFCLWP